MLLSGDSFIINQMSILSYCVQTELNDCPDHHVNSSLATFLNTSLCVNFHFPSLFLSFPFLCLPLISFSSFKFTFFSFSSFIPSSSSRFFFYYIFFFSFLFLSFFFFYIFIIIFFFSHNLISLHHSLHLTQDRILCGLLSIVTLVCPTLVCLLPHS